jgi:hypothetical protein
MATGPTVESTCKLALSRFEFAQFSVILSPLSQWQCLSTARNRGGGIIFVPGDGNCHYCFAYFFRIPELSLVSDVHPNIAEQSENELQ